MVTQQGESGWVVPLGGADCARGHPAGLVQGSNSRPRAGSETSLRLASPTPSRQLRSRPTCSSPSAFADRIAAGRTNTFRCVGGEPDRFTQKVIGVFSFLRVGHSDPSSMDGACCVGGRHGGTTPTDHARMLETINGCGDQGKDPDAARTAPDHDDCDLEAGWLATGDNGRLRPRRGDAVFLCGPESQKAANLARDNRVSLTIDHDTPQVMDITGLSMAAHAHRVVDPAEAEKALSLLMKTYPEQASLPLPMPTPQDVCIYRVTPIVISLLDYAKGFGHTDLVTCQDPASEVGEAPGLAAT